MPSGFVLWMMIMSTGNLVITWINQAMADGKITLSEAVDLVEGLGKIWDFRVELDIPLPPSLEEDLTKADEEINSGTKEEPVIKVPRTE